MKRYRYRAVCYVDVNAQTEEDAIDKAYETFPDDVDINQMTLWDTEDEDEWKWNDADNRVDEMKLSRFEDE